MKAAAATDDPFYDEYDIHHVEGKFPKVAHNPWLRDRLGRANVQRRQYLRYARKHRLRLSQDPMQQTRAARGVIDQPFLPQADNTPSLCAPSRPTLVPTDASTLQPAVLRTLDALTLTLREMAEDFSETTSVVTSRMDEMSDVERKVIDLAEVSSNGAPFECPYCWAMFQTRDQTRWRWVLQALLPVSTSQTACQTGRRSV